MTEEKFFVVRIPAALYGGPSGRVYFVVRML